MMKITFKLSFLKGTLWTINASISKHFHVKNSLSKNRQINRWWHYSHFHATCSMPLMTVEKMMNNLRYNIPMAFVFLFLNLAMLLVCNCKLRKSLYFQAGIFCLWTISKILKPWRWKRQVLLRFFCYFPFHNCGIGNLFIRNKDRFCFINGNLTLKNLVKQESFQHYYVFVTLLNNVFVEVLIFT
jgi:hypothetical protein